MSHEQDDNNEKIEKKKEYYKFVKRLFNEYGNTVKGLYLTACFIIIRLLLEPRYKNILDSFITKYQHNTIHRYIIIEITKIKNLKNESTDDVVKEWINKNFTTIESLCTFLLLFIEYIQVLTVTFKPFRSLVNYSDLQTLDLQSSTQDISIYLKSNNFLTKQLIHSKILHNINDSCRIDILKNTLDLIFLFMILSVYDFVDNEKMYMYVVIGLIISMSKYCNYNYWDFLIVYVSMFKNNKDFNMIEFYNLILNNYKEDYNYNTFEIISNKIYILIKKIINEDSAALLLSSQYIRYLIENKMDEFKQSRGLKITSNIIKIKSNILVFDINNYFVAQDEF